MTIQESIIKNYKESQDDYNAALSKFEGRFSDLAVAQRLYFAWAIVDRYEVNDEESLSEAVQALSQDMNNSVLRAGRAEAELLAYATGSANRAVMRSLFNLYKESKGKHHPLRMVYRNAGLF